MSELFKLFTTFFKIGLFTFGGGYAMLPLIEREAVDKKRWITRDKMLEYFSISQCTPGIIAVNSATLIGYKRRGFWGAFFAASGIVTPSLAIIIILASILLRIDDYPYVLHALAGIRAAVAALITGSCIKLFKSNVKTVFDFIFCIGSFIAIAVFGASPVIVVITAVLYGLFLKRKSGGDVDA
ncbi:MAG: chromate transporter [Oscillospiraceae bacterium]|nr:chromate transporter [Oscillospiraceae bacterium]